MHINCYIQITVHKEKQHQASHLTPHEINNPTERSLLTQSRQTSILKRRSFWLSTSTASDSSKATEESEAVVFT